MMIRTMMVVSVVAICHLCAADEKRDRRDRQPVFDQVERELIRLVEQADSQFDDVLTKAEAIADVAQRSRYVEKNDPAREFVPALLTFEEKHPGTQAGLMALRKVIALAASSGSSDSPGHRGRKIAFSRLAKYVVVPEFLEAIRPIDSGAFEPGTKEFLQQIIAESPEDSLTHELCTLMLARWMLAARDGREATEKRWRELTNGAESRFPNEQRFVEIRLSLYPEPATLRDWEQEAITMLQSVAKSERSHRQPMVKGLDESWTLVRIDPQQTKTMPLISEVAAGALFKESHLKRGSPAPELEVVLLAGSNWTLADQRGKVVIIQFSFKGSGPCEEMYPTLRELQQSFPGRVEILGIMSDKTREETESDVAEGKITWSVCWDGRSGPLTTGWGVRTFPTVYVFDRHGKLASANLRGQQLKDRIRELVE